MSGFKPEDLAVLANFLLIVLRGIDVIYFFQIKEYRPDRIISASAEIRLYHLLYDRFFPRFPAKSVRNFILVGALLCLSLFYLFLADIIPAQYRTISHGILLFLSPGLTYVFLFVVNLILEPFSLIKRNQIINQAKAKVVDHPNVEYIAISGSYGKSSTKEFLHHILSTNFYTGKTDKNMNSDVGIALSILKNLHKKTRFFIIEMGAYKVGENKRSCQIAPPQYAILTGLGNQHFDLFGSHHNILIAETEPIASLNAGGVAYVNADIPQYKQILHMYKNRVIKGYSLSKNTDIFATNIKVSEQGTQASVHYKSKYVHVKSQLLGEHNLANLLPCIALAIDLKIHVKDIEDAIATLKPIPHKLSLHVHAQTGATILDDSYNSCLDGFLTAIKTTGLIQKKRKFIISRGIIELGQEKHVSYMRIAKEIKQANVMLYTTDHFLAKAVDKTHALLFKEEKELLKKIKSQLDHDTLVLAEGRMGIEIARYFGLYLRE